jgi:hypothetical protein
MWSLTELSIYPGCIKMAPYSLCSALLLNRTLWALVVIYVVNKVPFGTQPIPALCTPLLCPVPLSSIDVRLHRQHHRPGRQYDTQLYTALQN